MGALNWIPLARSECFHSSAKGNTPFFIGNQHMVIYNQCCAFVIGSCTLIMTTAQILTNFISFDNLLFILDQFHLYLTGALVFVNGQS